MPAFASQRRRRHRSVTATLGAVVVALLACDLARCEPVADEAPATPNASDEDPDVADDDHGVFLPSDRGKERQLDRARRLVDAGNWTDAAAILDELLADDRDAFVEGVERAATRRSIRTEVTRMIDRLPPAGRDAYVLLFRARAERALDEAVARNDSAAVIAVARRWFETLAGRRAAMLTAVAALEAGDPVAAQAWLDRIAASRDAARFEPTLTLMRAVAMRQAGGLREAADLLRNTRGKLPGSARLGGRDVLLSTGDPAALSWLARIASPVTDDVGPDGGEWRQPRGDAARNALCDASRPLLAPRYRVPLTRHPEEARLLETRRRLAVAEGELPMPAGTPLVVRGAVVVHTPLGILGIDFETGRRLWLVPSGPMVGRTSSVWSEAAIEASLARVFDDATSSGLSSDGACVFAVESHPDALSGSTDQHVGGQSSGGWRGGNMLTAYEVGGRASVRWRLPARGGSPWFMGAPLVVGDELFVLVEEKEQVRLDVLDAVSGAVRWSQPLADLDEQQAAANPDSFSRRLAGLTPALGEGVLVCPLGGGTVVAVDVATRTLLWAHSYRCATAPAVEEPLGRIRGLSERRGLMTGRGIDPCPVIAGGRVFLTPYDADELVCLGLRDGAAAWPEAVRERPQIAGVVDGRLIVVGRAGVSAIAADTGRRIWHRPFPEGTRPSGRGVLTPKRLFLPVDAPAVIEIALADGAVVGRQEPRGGGVPGNLVAYRGEILSRGIESLDVFHQSDAIESRIETADRVEPGNSWAAYWRGQLELDGGQVAAGLARLRSAAAGARVPPGAFADALVYGMRRDFPAAAAQWIEWTRRGDATAATADVVRVAVDGFLRAGDHENAWKACRPLLAADEEPRPHQSVMDPGEPNVELQPDRWIRGRLAQIASRASPAVRGEIAAVCEELIKEAAAVPDPARRVRRLHVLVERLAGHSSARSANAALAAELDRRREDGDLARMWQIRRDFLRPTVTRATTAPEVAVIDEAWPLGQVVPRRARGGRTSEPAGVGSQVVPLALMGVDEPLVADVSIGYDMQHRRLIVQDGFGRRIVDPLPVEVVAASGGVHWINQASPIETALVGRVLFVRTAAAATAFDLAAAPGETRVLWRHALPYDLAREQPVLRPLGGRVARNGGVPLGRRITEPDDVSAPTVAHAPAARAAGMLIARGREVALLDAVTGQVHWERHGLPPVVEWIADDEVLCGCTADGRGSPVLSIHDGRLMHAVDLPNRRQRLASHGRRILAIVPEDDGPVAARVRIDVIDPLDRESRPLGVFAGEARATMIGQDHLAVVEPGGGFTVIDVGGGGVAMRTRLPSMPARPGFLHVTAWQDRYLVFVGGDEGGPAFDEDGEERVQSPLQGIFSAGDATNPTAGAVWAVDRADGSLLWPVPATVRRHSLHVGQPNGLPVLVFSRHSRGEGDGGRHHLSLLCLDKRTGHAVFEEDRIQVQPHLFGGCEVVGEPEHHSITIRGANGTIRPVALEFTGEPMPPRPPFQAHGRPPSARRGFESLERSLDREPVETHADHQPEP
jgi:outer membrane protein assembly factor BamB